MPNHIKNEVRVVAEKRDILMEIEGRYRYEDADDYRLHWPDFNKIVPMPEDVLKTTEGIGLTMEEMQQTRGRNWYDWSIANWGTKWNSYSHGVSDINWDDGWTTTYTFETAWSAVPDLIRRISEEYPDVDIFYRYADEDTGYNCGTMKFEGGQLVEEHVPNGGSKEAYELAFDLWGDRDLPYRYDEEEGTYVYDESLEVW